MAWFVKADSRNRGDEDETYLSPEIEIIAEDQQRYETMGKAYAQKLIDDYRAAGKNPYDYSLIATAPYHPYFSPFPLPCMMQGWRWPKPDQPFRNRLKRREGRIVDIVNTSFETYAVSQRVIDIIESIEPGAHQYLPYELICKDGSVHPDRRWLLNVCTRAHTLNDERSNVMALRDAPYFYADRTKDHRLVVRSEAIAGRAVWYEYRYRGTHGQFLLSDRFWDALNRAGCAGWRPDSFARGEHIEEL